MADKPKSRDDESLNFEKLEKELHAAVDADQRYWRENDAKFRAVHQKVATYDEFRDIVKASHLKPLEKGDKMESVQFNQPWNVAAAKNSETEQSEMGQIDKNKNIPKTGQEFVQYWRRYLKSLGEQYIYLISIGGDNLAHIFKTEISFGLLGDIVKALENKIVESDNEKVVQILEGLSQTNRFSLSVQFLSTQEKDLCNTLFDKLRTSFKDCDEITAKLDSLSEVYQIKQK
ncbi:Coiled-coil domain-containing protein 103 [Mytilus edulis]|uniref:Coiled-coil domain-containing protein 103 n=1 Tax=Mytilus edulis TaxID=6550 RepID=A0A8S3SBP3_MYTED|nr:Coiled-coil domain-containing protein 103 [Mytilus edulis]